MTEQEAQDSQDVKKLWVRANDTECEIFSDKNGLSSLTSNNYPFCHDKIDFSVIPGDEKTVHIILKVGVAWRNCDSSFMNLSVPREDFRRQLVESCNFTMEEVDQVLAFMIEHYRPDTDDDEVIRDNSSPGIRMSSMTHLFLILRNYPGLFYFIDDWYPINFYITTGQEKTVQILWEAGQDPVTHKIQHIHLTCPLQEFRGQMVTEFGFCKSDVDYLIENALKNTWKSHPSSPSILMNKYHHKVDVDNPGTCGITVDVCDTVIH